MLAAGADWGRGAPRPSPKVLLEYLSSNPTGPITVAHGRVAAVGDALTRLMRFAGYTVTPEFYINDAGNQVQTLALSTWVRYMETARAADASVPEVAFPENGYKGAYIRDFGRALYERDGARWVGATPPSGADMEAIQSFAIDIVAGHHPRDDGALRRDLRRVAERARAAPLGRGGRDAGGAGGRRLHRSARRRRLAEDDRALGRRQGSRGDEVGRAADLPAGRHRLPPEEAGARLRRAAATSGAPTTTATSRACRPRSRPSATIRPCCG